MRSLRCGTVAEAAGVTSNCEQRSTCRGIRAGARRSCSTVRSSDTRASCIRRCSSGRACRRALVPWRSSLSALAVVESLPAPEVSPYPGGAPGRGGGGRRIRARGLRRSCATIRRRRSARSRSACSTSSRVNRSVRVASRWRSRCGSVVRTALTEDRHGGPRCGGRSGIEGRRSAPAQLTQSRCASDSAHLRS